MPDILSPRRFPFLRWPLRPLREALPPVPAGSLLDRHLGKASYSVRLLRYWWAGQALAEESRRLGRPLTVVDLGCERGWLKFFTPAGAVGKWIGLDWNPRPDALAAGYDEVHHANFDEALPVADGVADAVISLHVFEHLPRPGVTMAEVARLLKPGAIFLGGAPTMPDFLARMREGYFRRQLAAGKIVPGGHITVLSPKRWANLAHDSGLELEFATGSHAIRMTGSPLENQRWWVRLNQIWGGLFPSLGSECYLQARRRQPWVENATPLPRGNGRPRLAWAAAALMTISLLGLCSRVVRGCNPESAVIHHHGPDCPVHHWIHSHQDGKSIFIVVDDQDIPATIRTRSDIAVVQTPEEALALLNQKPEAHVLVEASDLLPPAMEESRLGQLGLDSRLKVGRSDFFLLRSTELTDGRLAHYLRGT